MVRRAFREDIREDRILKRKTKFSFSFMSVALISNGQDSNEIKVFNKFPKLGVSISKMAREQSCY